MRPLLAMEDDTGSEEAAFGDSSTQNPYQIPAIVLVINHIGMLVACIDDSPTNRGLIYPKKAVAAATAAPLETALFYLLRFEDSL